MVYQYHPKGINNHTINFIKACTRANLLTQTAKVHAMWVEAKKDFDSMYSLQI